jgi:hypothetical protein
MWIDAEGVAHTVALPNPVDVMSPEFRASFDLLLANDPDGVDAVLGRAEELFFEEDLPALPDPEKESAFEALAPPTPLIEQVVRTADDVSAAVERADWRWRLDLICALIDYVDEERG